MLKTQQRFKCERHILFTEEINKIALSSNDVTRMQWIFSIETYAYGTNKGLVTQKEEAKYKNMTKQCKKMINFDDVIKKHKRACPYWPQIADNPYNTLLIGDSESRKTNSLSNLIGLQAGIDKRYFYVKDH